MGPKIAGCLGTQSTEAETFFVNITVNYSAK